MERKVLSARIIGVIRHRIASDGEGVTTLVGFWGCPLRCQYCLNPHSLVHEEKAKIYTPEQLYQEVLIDQLYFLATNGGITFGGGEPLLHPDFISEFRSLCGEQWNITVETSLNVPLSNLQKANKVVNNYIIDIKDINPAIYQRYTSRDNQQTIDNLKWLAGNVNPDSILVRTPQIPDFNTEEDIKKSETFIHSLGIKNIDRFTYQKEIKKL